MRKTNPEEGAPGAKKATLGRKTRPTDPEDGAPEAKAPRTENDLQTESQQELPAI